MICELCGYRIALYQLNHAQVCRPCFDFEVERVIAKAGRAMALVLAGAWK